MLNKETAARRKSKGRTELISVGSIGVGKRLREVGDVTSLAESMAKVGMENPVIIRMMPEGTVPVFSIVAGARRLAAAQSLKWETIEARVHVGMTDDEALAWEITENLHRLDLTAAERKKQVKLLADVFARMDKPAHDAPVSGKGGRGKKGTASKVAAATGMSKSQVNRILATGEEGTEAPPKPKKTKTPAERDAKVTDEAMALVRGTALDTPEYLKGLAKVGESLQVAKVKADLKEAAEPLPGHTSSKTTAAPPVPSADTAIEADTRAIMDWLKSRGVTDASEMQARFTAMLYRSPQSPLAAPAPSIAPDADDLSADAVTEAAE